MSHKPGARYGIMTLEDVRQRCFVDEDDHWHWRGALSNGLPRIFCLDPSDDKKKAMTGYQAVKILESGKAIPKGKVCYRLKGMCAHSDCVNPAHIKVGSKLQEAEYHRRIGYYRRNGARSIINRMNVAKRKRKITEEMIEEICRSQESGAKLARRLGIAESTVGRYRNGYRPGVSGLVTSIFALGDKAANETAWKEKA